MEQGWKIPTLLADFELLIFFLLTELIFPLFFYSTFVKSPIIKGIYHAEETSAKASFAFASCKKASQGSQCSQQGNVRRITEA